ncbi:hypothetical protein SDC9_92130 [bioreactor metagenome]|uniref:Uncharacterized protein n=1 Tax=bioreactor metagenome TaxID=1076179 RepID=A0A645A3L3_9ZZZZ
MRADCGDTAFVHEHDVVCIHHGSHALRDDDLCRLRQKLLQRLSNLRIRVGVHRTGGVIENQDAWFFEQRAGDAEALLLSAGDVGAALLNPRLIALRERLDEVVCLRKHAGVLDFFIGCLRISPAEVFRDGAGEEQVVLQNNGDGIAQNAQIIVLYVFAADRYRTVGRVIEPRNQLHERGFGRTGRAEDTDDFAGANVQVDVRKRHAFRLFRIAEADVVKVDRAVCNRLHRMFGAGKRALLAQNFDDTPTGFVCNRDHDKHHGEHHQAHQCLKAVDHQRRELANVEVCPAAARCDGICAKGEDEHHVDIQAKLHHGAVEREDFLRLGELCAEVFGSHAELLLFIVLANEGLHDADALYIFLDRLVQRVIFAEHTAKDRERFADDEKQPESKDRNHHNKDQRELAAHDKGHDDRENEHQRASNRDADEHHKRVLHVAHVRSQTRDQRGG